MKDVTLTANPIGFGSNKVTFSDEERARMTADQRRLAAGAGQAAELEAFKNQLEWSILNDGTIDQVDTLFLLSAWFHTLVGNYPDYVNAELANEKVGAKHKEISSPTTMDTVNKLRPYGFLSVVGVAMLVAKDSHVFKLPPLIPDWYSVFGPLGNTHSIRVYARLDDHWTVAPLSRFSTGERAYGSGGVAVFYANEKNKPKFYAGGEVWRQKSLDGTGGELSAGAFVPITGGMNLVGDLRYKTGGYTPDSATLDSHFTSLFSLQFNVD